MNDFAGAPPFLRHAQRNTRVGSARIELATICLGGSRTSFVLRADGDAGRVEAAVGLEPTCTALQAVP